MQDETKLHISPPKRSRARTQLVIGSQIFLASIAFKHDTPLGMNLVKPETYFLEGIIEEYGSVLKSVCGPSGQCRLELR